MKEELGSDRGDGTARRRTNELECFIVGSTGGDIEDTLSDLATTMGLPAVRAGSLAALKSDHRFRDASRPLVLIPDSLSHPLDIAAAIDFAREQGGRSFTVCLADAIEPRAYKQLVRTGSAEWITTRDCAEELRELVERITIASVPTRAAIVLSFLPSKGGVGTTSMVIEVATHLARRKREDMRLAILDLNLQGGTIADALDLEARFDVGEIIDRPERLDEHLVDVFKSRHAKGFDVFASPMRRIGPEALRPEIVFAVIDAIASRYSAILFDLPVQWTSWTDDLLRGSDAIVVCGGESVPALRRLSVTLTHLDGLSVPESKVATVVNAVETGLLGRVSRRALIEKALAGRRTFFVRRDDATARNALDVGRPLLDLAPHSGISRDVRSLAGWVETIVDHQPRPDRTAAGAMGAVA